MRKPELHLWRRSVLLMVSLPPMLLALSGCGGSSSSEAGPSPATRVGTFGSLPVSGLQYQNGNAAPRITDEHGRFRYADNQKIAFSLGELTLGDAEGADTVTARSFANGTAATDDQRFTNTLILLQTLDADGDLNNGIQITETIRQEVSANTSSLDVSQSTADFSTALQTVVTNLENVDALSDTDPRARPVTDAADALARFDRANSQRLVVDTAHGKLRGFEADESTWQFLGIPYARPPLGELRWRPPQAVEPWTGIRDAVAWGDQAAQQLNLEAYGEGGMSEDSLYLNITVPKGHEDEKLPVMVWFHGGAFNKLTGNSKSFNNTSLPNQGVIVVTVVHRLGVMGYFAHPALSQESEHQASGNYGQLDLIAALQWVRDNINGFNGDPDNVTVFGQSGGGEKILSLLHSPMSDGLFRRAIVQSGIPAPDDPINPATLAEQEQEGERLVNALGLDDGQDGADALRTAPWTDLVQTALEIDFESRPTIEGWYQPKPFRETVEAGEHNDVPILVGSTVDDSPSLVTGFRSYMQWWPAANASDMFVYLFDHVPSGWRTDDVPAYHGIELTYLFDYPESFLSHYSLGLTGHDAPSTEKFATVDAPNPDPSEYAAVSDAMMAMWGAFARTGNPSLTTLPWPAYTTAGDTYMEIGVIQQTATGLQDAFEAP